MTKVIKVSDETHERLTALKGDGETIDDVLVRQLGIEPESKVDKVLHELADIKEILKFVGASEQQVTAVDSILSKKNTSEATPQGTGRKVAGGRGAKDTFTPADNPEPLEQNCCRGKQPCKHWSYEANEMMYVNSLSGRRKEPEA